MQEGEPLGVVLDEKRDKEYPKDIKGITADPSEGYKPDFVFPSTTHRQDQT